ncbi:MAG: hypothetical protein U0350_11300 [Caldilineaceae bacterium]
MQKLSDFLVNSLIVCIAGVISYILIQFVDILFVQILISVSFGFLVLIAIKKKTSWFNHPSKMPTDNGNLPYWLISQLRGAETLGNSSTLQQKDLYIEEIKERLRNNPADTNLRWRLAKRYTDLREYKLAVEQYEILLRQRPELHDARLELVYSYKALRQWDAALSQLAYLSKFQQMASTAKQLITDIKKARG